MTWRVNFLRSKDAQKQLARTSLEFGYNYTELYLKGSTPLQNQLYFKTDLKLLWMYFNDLNSILKSP